MKRGELECVREGDSIVLYDEEDNVIGLRLTLEEARWLATAALPALLGFELPDPTKQ